MQDTKNNEMSIMPTREEMSKAKKILKKVLIYFGLVVVALVICLIGSHIYVNKVLIKNPVETTTQYNECIHKYQQDSKEYKQGVAEYNQYKAKYEEYIKKANSYGVYHPETNTQELTCEERVKRDEALENAIWALVDANKALLNADKNAAKNDIELINCLKKIFGGKAIWTTKGWR